MTATSGQPEADSGAGGERPAPERAAAEVPGAGGAEGGEPGTGPRRSGGRAPRGQAGAQGDTVAAVVRQWRAVHPGLDTGPMEVIGRINRCAALLQQAEDAPLRRAGLSRPEFDLLGALRRTGHELTPGELARETFSSGAAVTKRLKQLTERGLVERRGDTRDRRVAHVRLTDSGRDLVDGILPEQLTYETAVLSVLAPQGQDELAALLADLLTRLEGTMGALRS
ncbi:MarR family transcriptional regulator [Streptomyces sp. L2]|uniref:MarR family winged helix-turn-helix transcriptional regulator n=1 Tax=Streptomyces sp. L2 TaxID=2162665 RepID=UPI001013280D|nr:MarR family transcriptional regulator [Streptomyces sp. L2]